MPGAHALTPAALTSCACVRSLAIGWIVFEHMSRARRPLLITTGTRVWTLNPSPDDGSWPGIFIMQLLTRRLFCV